MAHGFTSQVPRNLVANIIYFIINIIVGVLLVPFFLSTLGVAAYGLIPLSSSIIGYVGLLVQSMNTAISRYLTVDLQRADYEKANKTFNTAFFSISLIILILVPILFSISLLIPRIFDVPTGYESGAIWLFIGVSGAFLIRAWSGNFTVSLFAYNRLDLIQIVNAVNLVVQVAFIIGLFSIFGPSLSLIGASYFIGAVSASAIAIILSRRINPNIRISVHDFDRSRIPDLSTTGFWIFIVSLGSMLQTQADLVLVNLLLGATNSGQYSIAYQWAVLLRGIATMFSGVLTPVVLTYYAKNQIDALIRVSKSSVKLMGLIMAIPIGLICGFAPTVLTLWVGEEYSFLAPLLILLTGTLSITFTILPLFAINVAYNRVKIPGVVQIIAGVGNIALAIFLVQNTGLGYYGVALAAVIVLTLKNTIFTPWYTAHVLGIPGNSFFRPMLSGVVGTVALGITAGGLSYLFPVSTIFSLAIVGGLIVLVYLVAVWLIGLNEFERSLFRSYLPEPFRSMIT